MKGHSSLESRLCLLVASLLFAVLLAVGYLQMTGQQSALIEEQTRKYESLSRVLALTYTPQAQEDNWSHYREFTRRLMQRDKDVSYIMISDSSGRVLFADTRELAPSQYQSFIGRQASKLMTVVSELTGTGGPETRKVDIPATVRPGERGKITVGFNSRSMRGVTEGVKASLFFTLAVAFLAGLVGAILLAKAITSPLKQLTTAAGAVESGDLDISVPVTTSDEVGELSYSFNSMVVALKENRDKLIQRANTDSLTGLYNHRYFHERLRSELKRAERYDRPLSMIMLDIDHFKALNDTHGHPVGDAVLQELAEVLLSEARTDIDVVTRYGGEEFALILPETTTSDAGVLAERLRLAIQRHGFTGKDGEIIPVTISLGVAQYPTHSGEPEGLILAADLAMYQSKSMGRNHSTLFSNDSRINKESDPYRLYLLLHATDISTIEAMAAAVDAKGERPPGFTTTVVADSVCVAQELGLSEKEQNDVRIASLLHDIGNLGISDAILNKQGPLTEEERNIIKSHPALGYAVIQKSPHLKSMLPGILSHHERWDGSGYPEGLKGEQIPLIARIIAVADAYHAMTTRTHCEARTAEDAKAELRHCAGTQFDPNVVDAFLRVLEREDSQKQDEAA